MSEPTLERALECLQSVIDELVVVGGTAHRLFPLHPQALEPSFVLLTTEDVDFAAPLELAHDGSRELLDRLLAGGFHEEVRGAEDPAFTYRLGGAGSAYLQFIAPLTGSGHGRDGKPDQLLRFSGISAEKLRHVDILLHRPWQATIGTTGGNQHVQVVNPVAYMVQKLVTMPGRGEKRGKDLLYVFDTLAIFGEALDELREHSVVLLPKLSAKELKQARRTTSELCFVESDVSRDAAVIARGQRSHPPSSRQIVGGCRSGLRVILADLLPGL